MKFLSNIYDPERADAMKRVAMKIGETPDQAWQRRQKLLVGKIIGEPQATEHFTISEPKALGMVGVYAP